MPLVVETNQHIITRVGLFETLMMRLMVRRSGVDRPLAKKPAYSQSEKGHVKIGGRQEKIFKTKKPAIESIDSGSVGRTV